LKARGGSWLGLSKELDRWNAVGRSATFWWRDDDAVDDTPELDRLLEQAGGIPLALAVIPALATRGLAERVAGESSAVVLQHGWRHVDHARSGGQSEYPSHRAISDVARELVDGSRVLVTLFGSRALPVFAAPWHGFDARFLPLLPMCGLIGISRRGPRPWMTLSGKLVQANTHVSLIRWSDPPSFGDEHIYIREITAHLRGRRLGSYDTTEPTGLLTHHRVQDHQSYAFISRFVQIVTEHPAASWVDARDVFRVPRGVTASAGVANHAPQLSRPLSPRR